MNLTGKYFNNRKGGFPDVLFYIIIIVITSIVFIVCWKLLSSINTEFQNGNLISAEGKSIIGSISSRYVDVIDSSFLIIVIGVMVATIIGAWFIKSHPALFWFSIPLIAFIIFFGGIFANVFNNFATSSNFINEFNDFKIIKLVMDNFVIFVTVFVFLVAIALFAKNSIMNRQNEI